MDRERRWKRVTALILIAVAVFGIAEDSQNTQQIFNEVQEQTADTDLQAEPVQVDGNSEETAKQDTEIEDVSDQESKSEGASEQETESENAVINYEELQCICRSGKYGYIDEAGKTVIPFDYDDAGAFVEGLAYFCIGEDYGFMDESLTPVFYLDCDSVSSFQGGLAYITVDGKYGYIDQRGETVIEPAYQDAGYFQDGCAIIMKNGKFGVIDKTGKEIVEPKYESMERGGENFIVKEGQKYQILDRNGKALLKTPCEVIESYYDPVVGFRDSEQGICGFAAGENVYYFEEYYEWMAFIPQRELVILRKDGSYGIKDFQGNTIKSFRYENLYYNPDEDVFYVTNKGESSYNSKTITADDFTGMAMDEKVKEKYAKRERLSEDLQYNKLTPRVPKYLEFLENGEFSMKTFAGPRRDISVSAWERKDITTRLYDFEELGKPVLYLWHKYEDSPSFEGFFAVRGDEVICLLTADGGGGSGGGEGACLWCDCEENRLLPGKTSHYGGGVFGASGEIYDFIDGECQEKISWGAFDHAGPEGGPMTTTYYVNGEEVSEESYKEVRRRYTRVDILR